MQQAIDESIQQLGNTEEEEVKNEDPNDLEDESVVILINLKIMPIKWLKEIHEVLW